MLVGAVRPPCAPRPRAQTQVRRLLPRGRPGLHLRAAAVSTRRALRDPPARGLPRAGLALPPPPQVSPGPAGAGGRRLTPAAGRPRPVRLRRGQRRLLLPRRRGGEQDPNPRPSRRAVPGGFDPALPGRSREPPPGGPAVTTPCVARGQKRCPTVPRRAEDRSKSSPPRVTLAGVRVRSFPARPPEGPRRPAEVISVPRDVWKGRKRFRKRRR